MQHIKLGTTLQRGKYRVEAIIGEGGFGNTYMATNCETGERIAIKEFFWRGVTERDDMTGSISVSDISLYEVFKQQKEKFRKEAARLQQFNNPHIVRVYDQFEENGTAYYVMDFIDGESLSEKMKRTGLPLTEQEVRELLPQMLDALKCVHDAGLLHLDLKPGNLMVDKLGNVKLIDFGASKQLDTQRGGATAKTRQTYTNGYAPREQMDENFSKYGPWTDLYALGATLYCLLTKRRPPMPLDLDDDESDDKHIALPFPENISEDTKSLIRWMMNTNRSRRPQSVSEMMGFANTTSQQSSHHYSNYSDTTFFSGQVGNERTQVTHHQNNEETRFSQSQSINEQTIASQQNGYNSYNQNAYNNTIEENHYYRNQKPSSNNGMVVFFILFGIILTLGIIVYTSNNSIPSQVDPIDIADTSIVDDYALSDTASVDSMVDNGIEEDYTGDNSRIPVMQKYSGFVLGEEDLPITMYLQTNNDGTITGYYYYNSKGSNSRLSLSGFTTRNGDIVINEYSDKGKTGQFFFCYENIVGNEMTGELEIYKPDGAYTYGAVLWKK